uniref:Lipocalin/cytosolic fatty-acid binding domain-containing protein n=1 Tax=Hucho hucho TaxID=62062 RepID=A0A4W5KRP0_9TELE
MMLKTMGVLLCATLVACVDVMPQKDFNLEKMAGKWWVVGIATNAQWFVKRKAGMKMGTSMMLPTAGGDLDISSAKRNADGSCWRMAEQAKKTDIPGRFTFNSQRWSNENDMRVVAVQYDDFALIHTIKTKHGVTDVLNKLFSRTPEVSADLQKKFMQFSLDTGILSKNIVILPKNGTTTHTHTQMYNIIMAI